MDWSEAVESKIHSLHSEPVQLETAGRVATLLDLTSLGEHETKEGMQAFFSKAHTASGDVAAVCVWPQFVRQAVEYFADSAIKVVTVVNFPRGEDSLETALQQISIAIQDGAREIDVVMPYRRYLAGDSRYIKTFVEMCKEACGEAVPLKVILETGILADLSIIADATYDVFAAGADFVKTSTGKVSEGASLEAVCTMLLVIKHLSSQTARPLGIKVSGGVRQLSQASQYIQLAASIMGDEWVNAEHFRIGASRFPD